ncbi:FIST N-terminal domain-containing protein [Sulfurimonas sp.]|uniref:FIST N-terminal domain-containing protein n=1 Tax=Sulfurimonas sp. TaxID=2022749 RepID=UPI002B46D3A5|nr:FIST N-terminal domain-containing protein [Sulfurimonas sp.]
MKTFNYILSHTPIKDLIDAEYLLSKKNILIQIFCGSGKDILETTIKEIKKLLPHAVSIGTTTDGEIQEGIVYTKKTVISISVFETTEIKSTHVSGTDYFKNGKELCQNLMQDNTKLIIVFTDGTTANGEEFLKGIESFNSSVMIAGGMAGDNGDFIQTFISDGTTLLERGAVGVSLNSDTLCIDNDYSFNWSPIGIEHKIDVVEANRVYKIDGITSVDFYAKYLGKDVANHLPATGIEFPLIVEKDGIKIARAVIAKHDDGSLSFAGNLDENDSVKLGFGNAEMIINQPSSSLEKFCNNNVESFFIYSCMARRRYMPDFIQVELEPFSSLASTAGFFTYGEFFHHKGHNKLLNQTLTVVALSESQGTNVQKFKLQDKQTKGFSEYTTTIKALTHLIEQSSRDLQSQAKSLAQEKQFSQELLDKQKLFMRHAIHETVTPLAVAMSNIELYELEYGKNVYLSNIEVAMKNIFSVYDDLSYMVKKNQITYHSREIDLLDYMRSRIEFFAEVAHIEGLSLEFKSNVENVMITFNETKLQRIVDNNLTNAIKYSEEGEAIRIRVDKIKTKVIITIESKSTHIINQDKIFEAYYRESKSAEGFGLGLNLVKQICDEEDVEILVSSDAQKTSFSYIFSVGD